MSKGGSPELPPRRCRQCQAPLADEAATCWLCRAPATADATASPAVAAVSGAAPPEANPWYLHAAIWLGIALAAVVGFGVMRSSDPSLAWLYALAVGPALLFTLAGAAVGRATGSPWHPAKKVLVFIAAASVSALLTVLIAILLLLAAVVAFLQWCFGELPPT